MRPDRRSLDEWAADCARSLDAARARRERTSGHPFPARWQEWLVALAVVLTVAAAGVLLAGVDPGTWR